MVKIQEKLGLNTDEVEKSRREHGSNALKERKKKSFVKSFLSNLGDPIIRILIASLVLNIIFMFPNINYFECAGILFSIIASTLVSTISEYSQENAFERLKEKSSDKRVIVKRNGQNIEISSDELVVGDLMILNAGEGIYADATLVFGKLKADESMLTGESKEIKKDATKKAKLLKGSIITDGYGEAIVTSVGENTYYGKIAGELTKSSRPSPLKKRLSQLAKTISILGYICAGLIALAYLFNAFIIDSNMQASEILSKLKDIKYVFKTLLSALTLAISIVVVAVPEGLPMMITVVLSSNMKKMSKDNVLVRKLVGIESSGNINLLFSDKTGTLTEGRLRVKELHTLNGAYLSLSSLKKEEKIQKYATLCMYYANSATLSDKVAIGSNMTDRATLELVKNNNFKAILKEKIPFDSTKKYSSALVEHEDKYYVFFKGAPEILLEKSDTYIDEMGKTKQITQQIRLQIRQRLKALADKSYRVVMLGVKEENCDTSLDKITFLCLVAIKDRVRKEVKSAVREVSEAGVGVVMITGDNVDTARSVAKECGIISPQSQRNIVLERSELLVLTDEELGKLMPKLAVVARALPEDKSRLVKIAQSLGYVVGMTGDGINDSPSLKLADVGFAMGTGTEVAKEAGDIVIKDNNFKSIVKAILYGRTIFNSIRKFVVFQLSMNLGAVGISLIGPFIGIDNPVTITQMLWVNIIMDTLGALAFASEPALKEYMKEKPKDSSEKIITKGMLKKIIRNGLYIIFVSVWFLKSNTLRGVFKDSSDLYLLSAFFAMFIFVSVFTCFVARTNRINLLAKIEENKSFVLIMLLIMAVQIAFIYFGGATFRAVPLNISDLLLVILISYSVIPFDLISKVIGKLRVAPKKRKKQKIKQKTEENNVT